MNANKKPELYVVQTPEMNAQMAEYHKNMSEEQKQLFLRQNRVQTSAERESMQESMTQEGYSELFAMGLRVFGNTLYYIAQQQLSDFKAEQEAIAQARYQELRQAIEQGKRFRLGQMQDMISRKARYREDVAEIAQLIGLPVDIVKAAVKRWIFF